MEDYALLIVLVLAWAIGTPIMAIVALVRIADLRQRNARLEAALGAIRGMLEKGMPVVVPLEISPEPAPKPAPEPIVVEAEAPALPPPFAPPPEPSIVPPPVPAVPKIGWEQRLGARAFIWVGAITLALSALFLVRYSIEEGYLSPEVRVILSALFGFGLIAGAERMRPRDDRVAQAMAAAGVAALYGALFAAVALYGMISQVAAGAGAVALTAFAMGISLRHGPFVAALAFVGGFASPAIIGSDSPNTPVLFGYLLAVAAGGLGVIRHRGWWMLGWGVLAGSALWTLVWTFAGIEGLPWVCAFLVGVAGLFVWATWRRLGAPEKAPRDVALLVWAALAVTGGLLLGLVAFDGKRQTAGWAALAIHGLGAYALGRWAPRFQYVAGIAPLLSLATLALWWLDAGTATSFDGARFAWLTVSFGLLYAGGAFALMWNAARPGFWAALSVSAALGHFLLCWWVLRTVETGTPWGLISIGLAAPFLVASERLARWRDRMAGATEALGYLAAGVSFFIAIAIPLELDRAWITVGYALELAAVAAIAARLELVAMRRICWGLLAVVVVRFVANPDVLSYPLGLTPIFNWILWGYGLSIAGFVVGRHYLRKTRDDRLVQAVEIAIALLAFVLVTLEVRSLFQRTNMEAPDASFMERAVYVLVWGVFALAALWMLRRRHDIVLLWTWRLSAMLAAGAVLVVQVLFANPIAEPADVGTLPIFNGLLVAYLAPLVLALIARQWMDGEDKTYAPLAGIVAGVLGFVYISMEVRHYFDPAFTRPSLIGSDVELYAYSFFWLLFGVGLLALGFARRIGALRHAGMILVCIVVAKVFLIDMAGLQGLLRVVSFLGLGAVLLALGYAYRRFGFDDSGSRQGQQDNQ